MSNSFPSRRVVAPYAIVLGLTLGLFAWVAGAQAGPLGSASRSVLQVAAIDLSNPQPEEPFGLGTSPLLRGGLLHKWRSVNKRLRGEQRILARCRASSEDCPPEAARFLAVVDKALSREGHARIAEINRAINLNIRPVDDVTLYGLREMWATPLMTFAAGAGDCEDYAIAKYVALREIGFSAEDLRLIVVYDRGANDHHAVAAVRYNGHWLILDNRALDLRGDVETTHFDPLFVLNDQAVTRLVARPAERRNPHPTLLAYD
jgi:predicted transglutaminase-like cysteine proteinase